MGTELKKRIKSAGRRLAEQFGYPDDTSRLIDRLRHDTEDGLGPEDGSVSFAMIAALTKRVEDAT